MDFNLTSEQEALADSVARFTARDSTFEARRSLIERGTGLEPRHWHTFAELGWLGAGLAEDAGGYGGGPIETAMKNVLPDSGRTDGFAVSGGDGRDLGREEIVLRGEAFQQVGVAGTVVAEVEPGADANLTETVSRWWCCRCQAMVWGPASRPLPASSVRSATIRSMVAWGSRVGLV